MGTGRRWDAQTIKSAAWMGVKRRLCFFEGEHGKGSKTNWNMIQYRLLHHCCSIECDHRRPRVSSAAPSQPDDGVLCKVYEDLDESR
ncbi:unnamed protein product [Coffea canephora]|uniref:NAC domain-containing protein n=1 Tax=Coffea canephora TaxID=49390 RepID=A0A068U651_COFCA|nr:unnamed protein product [Coffea canephora]